MTCWAETRSRAAAPAAALDVMINYVVPHYGRFFRDDGGTDGPGRWLRDLHGKLVLTRAERRARLDGLLLASPKAATVPFAKRAVDDA